MNAAAFTFLFLLVIIGGAICLAAIALADEWLPALNKMRSHRPRAISDRHTHRWTRWQVLNEVSVHLYGEVDEGRQLPDRTDAVMRRECARCGLPQTQTVRGLDSTYRTH